MQVIVKGRHTHIPAALKEQATQKLEKVGRFLDRIQTLEIEFTEEHNPRISDKHTVEVTLVTKAHTLRAHASGPDPQSAVDRVLAKIEAQVKKLKDRNVKRGRAARSTPPDLTVPQDLTTIPARNGAKRPIESEEEPGEAGASRITRVKRFAVKPMTAEEAVLQMESLGHDFFLFLNAESEQTGVVYRRRDGSLGLIEPD